jgi:Rrf2 family protein
MAAKYLPQCGEYALRAMAYLATRPDKAAVSHDIARETGLPTNYLQKILAQLTRGGLLTAQRGLRGGYALARPAAQITLQEVFKAVDADIERIEHCPLGKPEHVNLCPLHRRLDDAYSLIESVFKATTLASICESTANGSCEALRRAGIQLRVDPAAAPRPNGTAA